MKDSDDLIRRSFQRYLAPSILAILGGNVSFMADHIIAGQVLGSDALAAMSLANPLFFLFTTAGTLICGGSSTMASVALGKQNRQTANRLFTLAALLVVVSGVLIGAAGYLFLEPLVDLLSGGGELRAPVYDFCRGLMPGAVFVMAVYLPLNFFRIEGRAHLGMAMFLLMAALDIGLDLFFTAVLDMGMYGLAVATVLSSAVAVAVMLPFLFIKGGYRLVSVRRRLRMAIGIMIIGSPPALNNFYAVIRTWALNLLILASGGPVVAAGFAFANSFNTLAQAVISGMAQAVSPLVGVFYGEHDVTSIRKVVLLAVRIGVAAMAAFGILTAVFSVQICGLFGLTDPGQQAVAVPALVLSAASLSAVMVNQVLCFYYTTIGRTKIANQLTFSRGLLFCIPAAFLLSRIWGIYGVWISFSVSELLTLAVVLAAARRTARREKGLSRVLLLDYRDVEEGRYISFSVPTNAGAVMECSDQINEFCENCDLNPKQSMVIGLAIEEILILMLKHVFEGNHNDFIDVKIFVRDDRVIMRFRCGGRKFNPLAYYENAMKQSEESGDVEIDESMGLKLISKMAKQVDYSTNLGMNNIVIRL